MEKLSKNFIWMAAANICGGLFSAITGIYLARTLMPEALGYFSYVFTLVFFLTNFIDLGLSTFGMREIAGNRSNFSEYVSEITSFRLLLSAGLCLFLITLAILLPEIRPIKILMMESSIIFFISACATEWAFQGIEYMHMVFISLVVTGALQLTLALIFIKGPNDLFRVPVTYFAAAIPIIVIFLRRLKFKFRISMAFFRKMGVYLSSSIVIWSISVLAQVYNNLDIFLLGLFRSIGEVGCFTIARRVVGAVSLLMIFLANATLPRLSCAFAEKDVVEFRRATQKFLKLAIILTVFVLVPMMLFSRQIITLAVGSRYAEASGPLAIMIIGVMLVLFNLPYSTALIAACFEKEVLKQTAASASLSIILNFVLIPRYGMIGASVSFVFAEALALLWILRIYDKKIRSKILK